jgi:hypothetical protein
VVEVSELLVSENVEREDVVVRDVDDLVVVELLSVIVELVEVLVSELLVFVRVVQKSHSLSHMPANSPPHQGQNRVKHWLIWHALSEQSPHSLHTCHGCKPLSACVGFSHCPALDWPCA